MAWPPQKIGREYPFIVIVDKKSPVIPDLNLQVNDLDKVYELECLVKLKKVISFVENGTIASHQYVLELQEISKLKEE